MSAVSVYKIGAVACWRTTQVDGVVDMVSLFGAGMLSVRVNLGSLQIKGGSLGF